MENQPLTPYSNRGFNAQFLSIVPYSNPLLLDGVIASVDSLRIKFTYLKCYTDLATTRLFSCLTVSRIIPGGCWDSTT